MTPGDNATADNNINWQENQWPSTVNNSARAMMGRVAEWRNDISGQLTPHAGVNAKSLVANSAIASYTNGLMLAFRNNASNTGATTINVNGLGAKEIRRMTPTGDAALTAGTMITGQLCIIMYSTAADGGSGAWLLLNPTLDQLFAPAAGSSSITTVGALNSGSITSGFGNINIGSSTLTAGATTLSTAVIGDVAATPIVATRASTTNVSYEARPNSGGSVFWGLGAAGTWAVGGAANLLSSPWIAATATSVTFSGSLTATTGTFSGAVSAASYTGDGSTLSNIVPSSRVVGTGSGLTGGGDLSTNRTLSVDSTVARTSTTISAGTGLSGGGDLSANRSLSVVYGTTAGTAAQGNDSRITGAVPSARTISAGTGLTGGGNLSADRSLAVVYGTSAGTAAQGNDSRIVNAVPSSRNLNAGAGLTGGGNLTANRSFAVMAGDGITLDANGVNVDGTVVRLSTTSSVSETTFPIGHLIYAENSTGINRNSSGTVRLSEANDFAYLVNQGSGATLAGGWRCRGRAGNGNALMQRVS